MVKLKVFVLTQARELGTSAGRVDAKEGGVKSFLDRSEENVSVKRY